jgi:hypothetical protein
MSPITSVEHPLSKSSIEQQAADRLAQNPYFRGRQLRLRLEWRGETLVVCGRVATFYLKQQVQTVLKGTNGIKHIDNRIDVSSAADCR